MEYPEHEKLKEVSEQSQLMGELFEFLENRGYIICEYNDRDHLIPVRKGVNGFLAEMYNIDLVKIDQEKEEMLNQLRKLNKQ